MTGPERSWSARFPEGWWGYHWEPPTPMSAVELIGTPTIDSRLMATLWAVVARRRGVMLSSEAPQAGKTTLLSALVDFLPRRHDRHLRARLVGGVRLARRDPAPAPGSCSSTR